MNNSPSPKTIRRRRAAPSDTKTDKSPPASSSQGPASTNSTSRSTKRSTDTWKRAGALLVLVVSCGLVLWAAMMRTHGTEQLKRNDDSSEPEFHSFPDDFVWGTATSSFQIEGATHDDGRGESIWDTFCRRPDAILDHSNGDVACDHYHRMEEDVQLMKEMGIQAYRFSIAWPRILPDASGEVNAKGIAFYSRLIDTLLQHGIEPWVTLFHWDLPQYIEDEHEGWLSRDIVDLFGEYARVCFEAFGDRVQHWITLNEAWTVAIVGYYHGVHAPGKAKHPEVDVYLAGHHMILAHARAVRIYRSEFAQHHHHQGGQIGIAISGENWYPASISEVDLDAAERAKLFQIGWFADPIWRGDYPDVMREYVGHRLPHFTEDEIEEVRGSSDFFGLNHYSSVQTTISDREKAGGWDGERFHYWSDVFVHATHEDRFRKNDMGWSVVPDGLREILVWLSKRYGATIVITENGTAEPEPNMTVALEDVNRRDYFDSYLRACAEALEEGVDLRGYFAWSMLDNFEWALGYTKRFGLVHVDFETQDRSLKLSAKWYRDVITSNGETIARRSSQS